MHQNSMRQMARLVGTYLNKAAELDVLDVGSFNVNGTYKPLFANPNWTYTGADMAAGPNVDIVLASEFEWTNMVACSYDVVISGQTLEHTRNPFRFAAGLARVCKPGGLCFVICPWKCAEHRYPVDCWRVLPDGMKYLMEESGFELLECGMFDATDSWDTVYAGRKR